MSYFTVSCVPDVTVPEGLVVTDDTEHSAEARVVAQIRNSIAERKKSRKWLMI